MEFTVIGIKDVIAQLKTNFNAAGSAVISIDGVCIGGRRIVARQLAVDFGGAIVNADGLPNAGKLKARITELRAKGDVIVEGAFLRSKFADTGIKPDIVIYVIPAPDSPRRQLFDGILSRNLNDYLKELTDREEKELLKYHHTFHPIIHADYLVQDKSELPGG